MKEIGILYSTPMILAKLAGRKTVTRRTRGLNEINQEPDKWEAVRIWNGVAKFCEKHNWTNEQYIKTPFGQSGDILYGRELHYAFGIWIEKEGEYTITGKPKLQFIPTSEEIRFVDNPPDNILPLSYRHDDPGWYKRSSLFLPKEKSRIWERVISVSPERLGDITEEDAVREGVEPVRSFDSGAGISSRQMYKNYGNEGYSELTARDSFISLWLSIHGPDSWNPDLWVWRLETEVLSTTGRPENI